MIEYIATIRKNYHLWKKQNFQFLLNFEKIFSIYIFCSICDVTSDLSLEDEMKRKKMFFFFIFSVKSINFKKGGKHVQFWCELCRKKKWPAKAKMERRDSFTVKPFEKNFFFQKFLTFSVWVKFRKLLYNNERLN